MFNAGGTEGRLLRGIWGKGRVGNGGARFGREWALATLSANGNSPLLNVDFKFWELFSNSVGSSAIPIATGVLTVSIPFPILSCSWK